MKNAILVLCFLAFGAAHAVSDESVYNVDAKWTDQSGKPLNLTDFEGAPVVLAMIYTSCTYACPLTISEMQHIEGTLSGAERSKVKFVLVSFDPARDTPKRLNEVALQRKLDLNRWRLLTGSESGIRQLAAVLGVKYRTESGGFSHSSTITVLDSEGVIRQQKIGLESSDQGLLSALKHL